MFLCNGIGCFIYFNFKSDEKTLDYGEIELRCFNGLSFIYDYLTYFVTLRGVNVLLELAMVLGVPDFDDYTVFSVYFWGFFMIRLLHFCKV